MLLDLAGKDAPPPDDATTLEADVAVVGAGVAGLVLARRLWQAGLCVVVLESGGRQAGGDDDPLNAVETAARPYIGATVGRARGLGGTSTKWGGALLPFQDADVDGSGGAPAWPIAPAELAPYVNEVERLFGLVPGPYEADVEGTGANADFIAREAKWPTFARRNVARLAADAVEAPDGPRVVLNATVTGVAGAKGPDGFRVEAITATALSGRSLTVRARRTVIAAGAIESTRILLLLQAATGALTGHGLGHTFADHLTVPVASVETDDPSALNRLAGFRFQGRTMRSLRFELTPHARRTLPTRGGFVHIAPRPLSVSAFDHVRAFLRSVQAGRPSPRAAVSAALDAPNLLRMAAWRYGRKRLYWPRPSAYDVHVLVEQAPDARNAIRLGKSRDAFGQPRAVIDWRIGEEDVATLRQVAGAFDRFWSQGPLARYGRLSWPVPPDSLTADIPVTDIYHPVGSTRMAARPEDGVVDPHLTVFGTQNLSVAATSVLPTGGSANPTMTLLLCTLRLADRIAAALAPRPARSAIGPGENANDTSAPDR